MSFCLSQKLNCGWSISSSSSHEAWFPPERCACVLMGALIRVSCNFLCLFAAPVGSEGRRRSREEEEEEALKRKQLQEEHLSKVSEIIFSSTATNTNVNAHWLFAIYLPLIMSPKAIRAWLFPLCLWHRYECMCLCVDSIWFGKAHPEGGDGKRADQGASRTKPLCSTLRLQTNQLWRRYRTASSANVLCYTLHLFYWNMSGSRNWLV